MNGADNPNKKIKIKFIYADNIMKHNSIYKFKRTDDTWFNMTRYFNEDDQIIAIYNFKINELHVYDDKLIEKLEILNY